MTPQREEAERFLRLAKRDQAAFAVLLSASTVEPAVPAGQLVCSLLAWAENEIANHQNSV